MVTDAFLEADPVLKISEKIYNPQEYLYLDDGILKEIAQSPDPVLLPTSSSFTPFSLALGSLS